MRSEGGKTRCAPDQQCKEECNAVSACRRWEGRWRLPASPRTFLFGPWVAAWAKHPKLCFPRGGVTPGLQALAATWSPEVSPEVRWQDGNPAAQWSSSAPTGLQPSGWQPKVQPCPTSICSHVVLCPCRALLPAALGQAGQLPSACKAAVLTMEKANPHLTKRLHWEKGSHRCLQLLVRKKGGSTLKKQTF